MRVLAFHQCGSGSNPALDTISGLSLLLVLFSIPRGFSPSRIVPLLNNQLFQIPLRTGMGRRRTTMWIYYLQIVIIYLFIYLFQLQQSLNGHPGPMAFQSQWRVVQPPMGLSGKLGTDFMILRMTGRKISIQTAFIWRVNSAMKESGMNSA